MFEKFDNGKSFPNLAFLLLFRLTLQFQKQLMTKSETLFGFKPLGNH